MSAFVALMYHNLEPEPRHEYAITPTAFAAQLDWLADHGYVAEGFSELAARLAGRQPFPPRYCVLSFDDGHESNLLAAEMIRRAGFQATFFITRDAGRQPGFLREDGVRELSRLCSLGSHGVSHRSLIKLSSPEARRELAESREWLEALSGSAIRWFSAPGGGIDRRIRRLAFEAGYSLVGNSIEWWNRPAAVATTRVVHRVMVFRSYALSTFAAVVERRVGWLARRRLRSAVVLTAKRLLSEEAVLRVARWKRRWRKGQG